MSQNKDKRITFRVSPEEHQIIADKASMAQITVGTYVRAATLKHRIVQKVRVGNCSSWLSLTSA